MRRLATQFGHALVHHPASIYFLIPPLCPSESITHKIFGSQPSGLEVVGYKSSSWDDRIAGLNLGARARSLSCGGSLIAVALYTGVVELYDYRSFQMVAAIPLGGTVHRLEPLDDGFISWSREGLAFQDLDGNELWKHRDEVPPFFWKYMTSSKAHIIGVSRHGHVRKWDGSSGALVYNQRFEFRDHKVNPRPLRGLSYQDLDRVARHSNPSSVHATQDKGILGRKLFPRRQNCCVSRHAREPPYLGL